MDFKKLSGFFVILFSIFYFLVSLSFAQTTSQEDRATLERELAQLEKQIDQYENTISIYQKQGKSLKGEINKLNSNISKINLQIKAINLEIAKLDLDIQKNNQQIKTTEQDLESNKKALINALQDLYEEDQVNLVHLLLKNKNFSNFFSGVQGLIELQNNLRIVIQKVADLRDQLIDQKQELALRKSDKRSLILSRDTDKKSLEGVKLDKFDLLSKTKGEESKYQELLKVTKQTAAQIRSRIFQFLGGGELSFGDAYKFAKATEDVTGVRAALILAVLDKESAFGQNVGRCSYQEAMHPRRDIPIFLALVAELGISPNSVTVSCANRDGAYGGAMGPAQFIPSTWVMYKDKISQLTGHRPPNPWTNLDAFIATALYLKESGAANATISNERIAAAKYYAGSRWRTHLWGYGERVVAKARQFQEDIAELVSS